MQRSLSKIIVILVVVGLVLTITSVGIIMAIRQWIISPYYVASNGFAPTFTQGQYILVNHQKTRPAVGEYIIFTNSAGSDMLAEVLEQTNEATYRVRTSRDEQIITQSTIRGSVMLVDHESSSAF